MKLNKIPPVRNEPKFHASQCLVKIYSGINQASSDRTGVFSNIGPRQDYYFKSEIFGPNRTGQFGPNRGSLGGFW